jgi:hypothetical protein
MWLVPPATVSGQDISIPVTVLYDAADAISVLIVKLRALRASAVKN